MSLDLNDLLNGWPYEPGMLKVRKILGEDGHEKIQLRLDLGVIQMETRGRPDGQEPEGCESLLEYHSQRAERAEKMSEAFSLTPEEVGEMQAEGIQYYHRYISLFQLQDFQGVIRDTQRNLEMFDFVAKHAPDEEAAWSVQQFTPYVRMMNTRGKVCIAIEREDFAEAVRLIEKGVARIREFYEREELPEMLEESPELRFLTEWAEEIRAKQPLSKIEEMQRALDAAIAAEHYERAAELRDQIRNLARKR